MSSDLGGILIFYILIMQHLLYRWKQIGNKLEVEWDTPKIKNWQMNELSLFSMGGSANWVASQNAENIRERTRVPGCQCKHKRERRSLGPGCQCKHKRERRTHGPGCQCKHKRERTHGPGCQCKHKRERRTRGPTVSPNIREREGHMGQAVSMSLVKKLFQ